MSILSHSLTQPPEKQKYDLDGNHRQQDRKERVFARDLQDRPETVRHRH